MVPGYCGCCETISLAFWGTQYFILVDDSCIFVTLNTIPILPQDPRNKVIEDVLILSGDHLYRMDYMDFVQVEHDMQLLKKCSEFIRHVRLLGWFFVYSITKIRFLISRIIGRVVQTSLSLVCLWMTGTPLLLAKFISTLKHMNISDFVDKFKFNSFWVASANTSHNLASLLLLTQCSFTISIFMIVVPQILVWWKLTTREESFLSVKSLKGKTWKQW